MQNLKLSDGKVHLKFPLESPFIQPIKWETYWKFPLLKSELDVTLNTLHNSIQTQPRTTLGFLNSIAYQLD